MLMVKIVISMKVTCTVQVDYFGKFFIKDIQKSIWNFFWLNFAGFARSSSLSQKIHRRLITSLFSYGCYDNMKFTKCES